MFMLPKFATWDNFNCVTPIQTPGQFIRHLLNEKGWTQEVLAIVLGVAKTTVSKIVNDQRAVDAEMAILLGQVLEIAPERFLDLQKAYDLAKARLSTHLDPTSHLRAQVFSALPVPEMIRRGWLQDVETMMDVSAVEASLAKFFDVPSIDQIEILPHAAKKTNVGPDVTPAQLAWLYRVKQLAADTLVSGRYSPTSVGRAITTLKTLTSAAEEARKVPRILSDAGIRFVVVEALTSSKIDGVCFWLHDMAPVVGVSMRFDRIDNFWFVLRHELEHVSRRHGLIEAVVDADLESARAVGARALSEEERVANEAASDFCVPRAKMEKFYAVKKPFYNERDILGFARTLQIHPGLVAGQLQHRTGRYDLFRNHLVKIRAIVNAAARHDGWGDVAPIGQADR